MQKLGSTKLHSDILGHVIMMRSRVQIVVQQSIDEKDKKHAILKEKEEKFEAARDAFEKASLAAKRGLKQLKDEAKKRREEFDVAQSILNGADNEHKLSVMWCDRSKNVELTLQCFLQSIVEAIGFLGFTLEEPKDIAIETFVVDELISLSRIIEDDDATSVAICKTLEQLTHRSPKVRRVIFNTDGFHVMIELFKHRSSMQMMTLKTEFTPLRY